MSLQLMGVNQQLTPALPRPRRRRSVARPLVPVPASARAAACTTTRSPQEAAGDYRLSRWGRLAMTLIVLAAVIVATVTLLRPAASGDNMWVTVGEQETIVSVATRLMPDVPVHDAVAQILQLNGLADWRVPAGTIVQLPVAAEQ